MANVLDAAAYILDRQGSMTTWKLQKLVYYSQAWSLVWDDDVLFPEGSRRRRTGRWCALYNTHRGKYRVSCLAGGGDVDALTDEQRETVDAVLAFYGDKSPQWLSDLTHMETPWQTARRGVPDGERGNAVIAKKNLSEYYGSL